MPTLARILIEEWDAIPQETIDSLIESTPARFQLSVEQHGKHIGDLLSHRQKHACENHLPILPGDFMIP
jgi:hypothetical protein